MTTDDVNVQEVRQAAEAARLRLTAEEEETMAAKLERMKDLFLTLEAVDVDGVKPLVYGTGGVAALRADEARPSLPREDVLRNAPETEDGFFKVPRVLDEA